jgi:uncharacterized coiled-coil DUF342 family protein
MSDDIVARLRIWAKGLESKQASLSLALREAVNQIESVQRELNRLYAEIERLRAERDEARREICQLKGTVRWNHYFPHFDPKGYAKNRGWDCHKDYK